MTFSLCGQYWNKCDSFVNIKDSLLFIHEKMQENVINIIDCAECGIRLAHLSRRLIGELIVYP